MEFEYDNDKSKINKGKHGIDFEEAQALWESDYVLTKGYFKDEIRYMLIGKLEDKMYTCIFTKRLNKLRLISCRRSRKSEEEFFHEKNKI